MNGKFHIFRFEVRTGFTRVLRAKQWKLRIPIEHGFIEVNCHSFDAAVAFMNLCIRNYKAGIDSFIVGVREVVRQ